MIGPTYFVGNKINLFSQNLNITQFPKMGLYGVSARILNVNTHNVNPDFKGIEKRMRTVETILFSLNSVKYNRLLKFLKLVET